MQKEQNNNSECFKVAVRCRPISSVELELGRDSVVSVNPERGEISIKTNQNSSESIKTFTFDTVFESNAKQEDIYKNVAYPIVENVLEGYNGTIFAYGQTGTGKTFTVYGRQFPNSERGIAPRTFEHIFHSIKGNPNTQFLLRASFLEIYLEEIKDLLSHSNEKLELRENPENGVFVKNLTSYLVQNEEELNQKLLKGIMNRHQGSTKMSDCSSRSHSIFSITIERCDIIDGESHIKVGKLNIVDLAGSERQNKTQATGERFKEGIKINQSLVTLGNVISSLIDPKATHIPYRDSKLTRLLQDSLGGNTKTVMIANIGPADYNSEETISTLRYAYRAKAIKNSAKINEDPKQAIIRQFQEEITSLKLQIEGFIGHGDTDNVQKEVDKIVIKYDDEEIKQIKQKLEKEKSEMESNYQNELQKIEDNKLLQEKEKEQLVQQLLEKEQIQQQQKDKIQKLLDKLQKMQKKVILGENTLQKVIENEKKLNYELQQMKEKNKQASLQIQQNEDLIQIINQKYQNQAEESQEKQNRIQFLFKRLLQIKLQNQELDQFYISEMDQLQENYRILQKELKFKYQVLLYFIPQSELKKISEKMFYSEDQEEWIYPKELSARRQILSSQQSSIQEIKSDQVQGDQNIYFVYTQQGPARKDFFDEEEFNKKTNQKNLQFQNKWPGTKQQYKTKIRSKSLINSERKIKEIEI